MEICVVPRHVDATQATWERRGGWNARLSLWFPLACSADHERNRPPCKVVFFGLATSMLNVRNNNNNTFSVATA